MVDTFVALSSVGVILAAVAIAAVLLYPLPTQDTKVLRRLVQFAAIMRVSVHFAFCSSMTPIAYAMTADPARSGALMAATQAFFPLGAVVGRLALAKYEIMKVSMMIFAVCFCANGVLNAVCCFALEGDGLVRALFVTRGAYGFLSACLGVLLESATLKVTPASETANFWQLYYMAISVGYALGLLLVDQLSAYSFEPVRLAMLSSCVIAQIVAITALLCLLALPRNLSLENYEGMDATQSPEISARVASEAPMSAPASANMDNRTRKLVWFIGSLAWINSACIVSCCQAGTPMLLEAHFGWSTTDLAFGLGIQSLCTVPLLIPLLRLEDVRSALALGAVAVASALSLVPAQSLLPGRMSIFILSLSACVYALVASSTSLIVAAASHACLPGSFFNEKNLIVSTYFDGPIVLATAMTSRQFIFSGGTVGFAVALATVISVQCVFALILVAIFARCRKPVERAAPAFPTQAELALLQR